MVWDIVRDSTFGQVARYVTGNKVFPYPEETTNFEFSQQYGDATYPPNPRDEAEIDGEAGQNRSLKSKEEKGSALGQGSQKLSSFFFVLFADYLSNR
jgi:hypothetical protein